MNDRPAANEDEAEARRELVSVALAMLAGTVPFNEGASQVMQLRARVAGVAERDEHFDAFSAIASEISLAA